MTYDQWKTTNPDDESLGPEPCCEVCNGDKVLPVLLSKEGEDGIMIMEIDEVPCPFCSVEPEFK
jgi:hypothetical protein